MNQISSITEKPNKLKYKILSTVFDSYLTSYEISLLLFDGQDFQSEGFQQFRNTVKVSLNRYSKKAEGSHKGSHHGFQVPYLSKRWIKSQSQQKERHGLYEYRTTEKGRRMVCEWNYRIRLGHTTLKWTGDYFMPRTLCDGDCKTCPMYPA